MNRAAPFVLPLLLTTLPAQENDERREAAIVWQTDLAAARQLAAERHAPLFVVFRCER